MYYYGYMYFKALVDNGYRKKPVLGPLDVLFDIQCMVLTEWKAIFGNEQHPDSIVEPYRKKMRRSTLMFFFCIMGIFIAFLVALMVETWIIGS